MPRRTSRLLIGLYGSTFLLRISFAMVLVLVSARNPGISDVQLGLLNAILSFAELLTVPLAGLANDRYGRRPIFLIGLGIATCVLLARAFVGGLAGIAALNFLQGIGGAMVLVTSLALLADNAPKGTRGREMGTFDFLTLFGYIIGFVVAFLLLGLAGERADTGFVVAAAFGAAAWLFAWKYVQEPAGKRAIGDVRIMDIVTVAAKPRVALVIGPWLVVFMFLGAFSVFLDRLTTSLGFGATQTAIGIVVLGLVLLVSQVGYGHLSDRYGRPPVMLLGAAGFFVLMTMVAVLVLRTGGAPEALLLAMRTQGPFLAIAFLATLAFGPAALAALADEAESGPTGLTMSLYSLVLALGYILGPVTVAAVKLLGPLGLAFWFELLAFTLAALVWLRYRHDLPTVRIPLARRP